MDPEPFKQVAKMLWSLGDYREIAKNVQPVSRELVDACKVRPGLEVLDVAAGNGNTAIAAAWRGAKVVASDLTPAMVQLGRERTAAEGIEIEWHEADVESLPFEDDRFDVVMSTFGALFAPRPEIAASEMFRVLRPRGILGMTNWTADGFIGQTSQLMELYAPPRPPGVPSPMAWGDPEIVEERLSGLAGSVHCEPRMARFSFPSVADMVAFFEKNLGPMVALKNLIPPERYAEMLAGYRDVIARCNQATGEVVVDSGYLLVIADKPAS